MTKKELIKMLSSVPDDAQIVITKEYHDLISNSVYCIDIRGYYENGDRYVLCSQNVRPYIEENND